MGEERGLDLMMFGQCTEMRRMRNRRVKLSLYMAILTAGLFASFAYSKVKPVEEPKTLKFKYTFEPEQKWDAQDVKGLGDGAANIQLHSDSTIALHMGFIDVDLVNTVKTQSVKAIAEKIVRGKNIFFSTFSKKPTELVDARKYDQDGQTILEIRTRYFTDQSEYLTLERYYILPNKTLLASMRWKKNTSDKEVKLAEHDLDKVKVDVE